jgi:hypothetical protein
VQVGARLGRARLEFYFHRNAQQENAETAASGHARDVPLQKYASHRKTRLGRNFSYFTPRTLFFPIKTFLSIYIS